MPLPIFFSLNQTLTQSLCLKAARLMWPGSVLSVPLRGFTIYLKFSGEKHVLRSYCNKKTLLLSSLFHFIKEIKN